MSKANGRPYKPKWVNRNPLAYIQPAPAYKRNGVLLKFEAALQNMMTGTAPVVEDWRTLADSSNTVECMAVQLGKLSPAEVMPFVNAASAGLQRAKARHEQGKGIRLDAEGIAALRAVIDIYAQCMEGYTEREIERAQLETTRQVRRLQHAADLNGHTVIQL